MLNLPSKSCTEQGQRLPTSSWTFQQGVLASLKRCHNLGHHCNLHRSHDIAVLQMTKSLTNLTWIGLVGKFDLHPRHVVFVGVSHGAGCLVHNSEMHIGFTLELISTLSSKDNKTYWDTISLQMSSSMCPPDFPNPRGLFQ